MFRGPIGNAGGPNRTVQQLALEIARGNVPGSESFGSFGEFIAAGPVTNHIIWPNGSFVYPDVVTGLEWEIVSSDINDTVGGSGVEQVEVHLLTNGLVQEHVTINMNGQTPVTTDVNNDPLPTSFFFQCTHVQSTGTPGQGAVGNIIIRPAGGGATYALISAGDVRCSSSARMVPANKRAVVYALVGSSISGTAAAQAKIQVVATELDNHQYTDQGLFIPFGSIGVQDASETLVLPVPGIYKSGTIIAMNTSVDKAATVTGDWFGWIEDA